METRDFKGVWIPKEIWLSKELTMLEKAIFVEIDSLDNENHCIASNEYFAEFCDCSVSKVSKAISKLKELGMIEEIEFDGRHRKIKVICRDRQGSKKCYADYHFLQANNIDSNIVNNKTNSKELVQNFEFGKSKEKKENLYSKCVALIDDFTNDIQLRTDLTDYLKLLLEMRKDGYVLYTNTWKGILRKLADLSGDDEHRCKIVRQSIERGYKSLFPLNTRRLKALDTEYGVVSDAYTSEELAELKKLDEEREKNGQRTKF